MEQTGAVPPADEKEKERDRRPLFVIIMVALLSILCMMVAFQVRDILQGRPSPPAVVEYPVHSGYTADYQPEQMGAKVPAVKLTIIREVLQDIYFYEDKLGGDLPSNASAEIHNALNNIIKVFSGSVPTATPYLTTAVSSLTETPLGTPTPLATDTTQTVTPVHNPTPVSTQAPTATTPPYVPPPYVPPARTSTPVPLTVLVILTPSAAEINEPGATITYQLQVKNTYSEAVALLRITDSVLGDLDGVGTCNTAANPYPADLAAGDTYICYFNHGLFGNAGDSFANTVTAKVKDAQNRNTTGSADTLVKIKDVIPTLTVSKTAGVASVKAPGGTVLFTVKVSNTSVEAVTLTKLTDNKYGDLNGKGTCATGGSISSSGEYSCKFYGYVSGTVG
ncbi:MAG: hypothetical protein ACK2T7_06930, partial [Anaerolineales bacterium]